MKNWAAFEAEYPVVCRAVRTAMRNGKLSHSYLVVSSNQTLRTEIPPVLASLAVCLHPNADGSPCGVCSSCRSILDGSYPDLFTLAPSSKSRQILIGDPGSDTYPGSFREFEHFFFLSSNIPNGWKIGIVYEADAMNENAQNAFLKTLEEPPKNCLFILATGKPSALLPTIRSRCQRLDLSDNRIQYHVEKYDNLLEILYKLSFQSQNNLVVAEECAAGLYAILLSLKEEANRIAEIRCAIDKEKNDMLDSAAKKILEKRKEGVSGSEYRQFREEFLSIIHTWFAQLLFVTTASAENLPNPEIMRIWLQEENPAKISPNEAVRFLSEAEYLLRVLRSNVNDELAIRCFAYSIAFRVRQGA